MGFFRGGGGDRRGGNFRSGGYRGGGGGRRFGNDRAERQMFDAICSNCGNACQVPFNPSGDKPVYCSDCFEKMNPRNDRNDRGSDRPRFENRAPRVDTQFKTQLDALNSKLDKIISLLELKVVEKPTKKVAKKKALTLPKEA